MESSTKHWPGGGYSMESSTKHWPGGGYSMESSTKYVPGRGRCSSTHRYTGRGWRSSAGRRSPACVAGPRACRRTAPMRTASAPGNARDTDMTPCPGQAHNWEERRRGKDEEKKEEGKYEGGK